jgi:DsbC/DsbD-like thiol-disulfide interchange protein
VRCKFWGILIAMLAMASTATAAPKPHIRATLLADVKQIVPGKPFRLGVLLSIDSGWHTYWLNPGDSGEATKIKLDLPKGFTAGEVQFPTPIKIADPGGINVYGYTDSVMFITTVTPAKSLAAGEADLSAKVSYLVCNNICVPGHTTVDLKLPIAATGVDAGVANKQLFGDWTALIPTPPNASPLISNFKQDYDPSKGNVGITFIVPPGVSVPDIFPGPNDNVSIVLGGGMASDHEGGGGLAINVLTIKPLAGQKMPGGFLPVVLAFQTADGHRHGIITEVDLGKLKS